MCSSSLAIFALNSADFIATTFPLGIVVLPIICGPSRQASSRREFLLPAYRRGAFSSGRNKVVTGNPDKPWLDTKGRFLAGQGTSLPITHKDDSPRKAAELKNAILDAVITDDILKVMSELKAMCLNKDIGAEAQHKPMQLYLDRELRQPSLQSMARCARLAWPHSRGWNRSLRIVSPVRRHHEIARLRRLHPQPQHAVSTRIRPYPIPVAHEPRCL